MAVTSNHVGEMYGIMQTEFKAIGIELTNVSVKNDMQPQQLVGQYSPSSYSHGYPVMSLHFTCNQEQFSAVRIFVSESHVREIPSAPPVHIYGTLQPFDRIDRPPVHRVETVFDCVISITVTGGSVDPFIHSFRHETEKLRYAIESMQFDKEVEKMLTDDGYNN